MAKWTWIEIPPDIRQVPEPKPWVQRHSDERIEWLARAYCTALGLDPDEPVQVDFDRYMLEGEFQCGAVYDIPGLRWQLYRRDVQKALAMREIMAVAEDLGDDT